MKTFYKLIAVAAIFFFILTAGILLHEFFFTSRVWFSTTSPNKTYTIELTGDKGRGGILFYSTVRFNALRNGQTIVKGAHAHSGDFMDISFELAYPEHEWVSDNIARFWRTPNVPESNFDQLVVSNNSGKAIKFLKIYAMDMFLIFDMQPNSTLKISASHQSWASWIKSEGEFIDGQPISGNGVNFLLKNGLDKPFRYCISISENGLKIENARAEGYDRNGSSERPNVPIARDCNP